MTKSLKNKLYLHIFIILKKSQKIVLYICMHFGFNKQFINIIRTWSIFQKYKQNYLVPI
jgi:hypothetical protein